jgi:hypothetical protein
MQFYSVLFLLFNILNAGTLLPFSVLLHLSSYLSDQVGTLLSAVSSIKMID